MKRFYEHWTEEERKEYIIQHHLLVLFEASVVSGLAIMRIYGNLEEDRRKNLHDQIIGMFGGSNMTDVMCNKINEYAEKWYRKVVLNKQARVLNSKRRKK